MRTRIFAANWKMNKTPWESAQYFEGFKKENPSNSNLEVLFFPPATSLETMAQQGLQWGAQNCHFEVSGAFTGELSPQVLKQMGANFALIGHSERRILFGEKGSFLSQKVTAARSCGLKPVFCVGETLSDRESGKTEETLVSQIRNDLPNASIDRDLIIAYEPVWAIGTGKVASPDQAAEAHKIIRNLLMTLSHGETANQIRILYGGSVKPENAGELIAKPDIDGFLVGGASLEISSSLKICAEMLRV